MSGRRDRRRRVREALAQLDAAAAADFESWMAQRAAKKARARGVSRAHGRLPRMARHLLHEYRRFGRDPAIVRAQMDASIAEPENAARYAQRKLTVEPVFGQIKHNRGYRRFTPRGLAAVDTEWKLICAAANHFKIHRQRIAAGG